jgi:hypothetical protein
VQVHNSRKSRVRVVGHDLYGHEWSFSVTNGVFSLFSVFSQSDFETENWSFMRGIKGEKNLLAWLRSLVLSCFIPVKDEITSVSARDV